MRKDNKTSALVATIVTMSVSVVLVAALLMPVIEDSTATTATFTNDGIFDYGIFGTSDTYVFEYDNTGGDGKITVNDVDATPASATAGGYSVVASENVIIRYGYTSSDYYVQVVGTTSSGTTTAYSLGGAASMTLTITSGAIVVNYTTSSGSTGTATYSFTELYGIVPETNDAVLKISTDSVYILGSSELYATGLTAITAWSNVIHFEGTYTDGITISSPNTEATFDNIVWNIEAVEGYENLYKLTSIEFDATIDSTTVHCTYSYFAVPTEVTAELSEHLNTGSISLINAIPILVIVAILMLGIRMVVTRQD